MLDTVIQKMSIKTYSELVTLPTFEERFQYLKLDGIVGDETFGCNRYLNQIFYKLNIPDSTDTLSDREYHLWLEDSYDV